MQQDKIKQVISKIKIEYDKEFPATELGRQIAMIVGFNKYKVDPVIKSLIEYQVIKPAEATNHFEWDCLDGLWEEETEDMHYEDTLPTWMTDESRKYYLVEEDKAAVQNV